MCKSLDLLLDPKSKKPKDGWTNDIILTLDRNSETENGYLLIVEVFMVCFPEIMWNIFYSFTKNNLFEGNI